MTKKIVLFMPVIHTGYISFLEKHKEGVFLIGNSILEKWEEYDHLKRDLRTMDFKKIQEIIKNSNLVKKIEILETNNLDLLKKENDFILPNEDVSHWFADNYLKNKDITYENTFLRWNKPITTREVTPIPNITISESDFDKQTILNAEKIGKKSANWWRQVGVILINENKEVVLSSYNKHVPTQYNIEVYGDMRTCFDAGEQHELSNSIHGEADLIATAAKEGILTNNCSIYVTTFPCPTCAKLIVSAGIKNVYYKDGYSLSDAEQILNIGQVKITLVK